MVVELESHRKTNHIYFSNTYTVALVLNDDNFKAFLRFRESMGRNNHKSKMLIPIYVHMFA